MSPVEKKEIDFLRLHPSTTSPKTKNFEKKEEEKGTRDTPIFFLDNHR